MGVFFTDRLTGAVHGLSTRLWGITGDALAALSAPWAPVARRRDGYVPAWLARAWGGLLFDRLGDLVVVARPVPGRRDLRPVALYAAGSPAALRWSRAGEQLSAYDLPLAPVLLATAQFWTAGTGHTITTLRPPAPGTPVSAVAARSWQVRSGVLPGRLADAPAPRVPHLDGPRPPGPPPAAAPAGGSPRTHEKRNA